MEGNVFIKSYSSETEIIENLKDAGCCEETICEFLEEIRQGEVESGKRLLETHRRTLLNDLHQAQKHIDCLDYLVWQIDRGKKRGSKNISS